MIVLWLLLTGAMAAQTASFDPFPAPVLRAQALEPSTDPGTEPNTPTPDQSLPPSQQAEVLRFASGRRMRDRGFVAAAVSSLAILAGSGIVARSAICRRCGNGGPAVGGVLIVTGIVGLEVGAGMSLVGVERERKSLQRLSRQPLPGDAIVLGWTSMLVPVFGAAGGLVAAGRQSAMNDRALSRLRRSGGR